MATAEFSSVTKRSRYEFALSVAFAIFFAGASLLFARELLSPSIHTRPEALPVIAAALTVVGLLFGVSAFFSIRLVFEIEGAKVTDSECTLVYRYLGQRSVALPFGGRLKRKVYLPDLRSDKGYREAVLVYRGLTEQVLVPLEIQGAERLGLLLSQT